MKNIDVLEQESEAVLSTQPTAHWVEKLDAAEVPGGPMLRYEEVIKSTGKLTAIRKPAPWLGQHSAEVLRGIGYGAAEIEALFAGGVVYDKFREGASAPA